MKIIDAHTHIASTRFVPQSFMEGVADNIAAQMCLAPVPVPRSRILERLLAENQDHDGNLQIREMNKLGIEKSVVLLPDFTYALPGGELTIAEMYREHGDIRRRHPERFIVFAGTDPRWGKDGFDLFVKGVEEYGFRGLKLYPPCGYRPDSELLTPYYEYCQAFRLPVLLHIGATSPALSFSEAMPIYVDEPARKYNDIPFILAHGAVSYSEQCVQLCKYRPNVYLDLSGAQHNIDDVIRLCSSGINHKCIFGTDWPINNVAAVNKRLLGLFSSEKDVKPYISLKESELVLAGNIERLLSGVRL